MTCALHDDDRRRMAILAEGDAQNREDLIYLEKLPLFTPDGTPID